MREAKRSRSGLTHSNREIHKSKRTNASHSFFRNQFLGNFNRRQGTTIGISLLLITLVISVIILFAPINNIEVHATGINITNVQPFFRETFPGGTMANWNSINSITVSQCFQGISNSCMELQPINSTEGAIAISKSQFDLGTIGTHLLYMNPVTCFAQGAPTANTIFGVFLTRNNTLPPINNYNPRNDPSVSLIIEQQPTGGTGSANHVWIQSIVNAPMVQAENAQGSGDLYLSQTATLDTNICSTSALRANWNALQLNYTGVPQQSLSELDSGIVGGLSITSTATLSPLQFQGIPFYLGVFMTGCLTNCHVDFQVGITNGNGLEVSRADPNISVTIKTPTANVDVGGFFGPLIKALIPIAVFVWQQLINFFAFLESIFNPILAGVISLLSGVFIAIFNALGGIFGDPTLGNDIGTFFSNLTSYFANIFGLAITIITGIAGPNGLLANAVQIAINFLSGSNNFVGVLVTIATGLAGLIPVLSGFWTLLVSLFNLGIAGADFIIIIMLVLLEFAAITDWIQDDNPIDALVAIPLAFFLFYFLANAPSSINIIALNTSVSANYNTAWNNIVWFIKLFPVIFFAIFFEWIMNLDETARFHRQQTTILHNFFSVIKFYRLLTVDVVMGSWWFFDNAFDMITKGITAIKGRWSPVEVAGTG